MVQIRHPTKRLNMQREKGKREKLMNQCETELLPCVYVCVCVQRIKLLMIYLMKYLKYVSNGNTCVRNYIYVYIRACNSGLDITTNCLTFSLGFMSCRTEHKLRWGVDCDMNQQKLFVLRRTHKLILTLVLAPRKRPAQHTYYCMELRYFRIHFLFTFSLFLSLALFESSIWCVCVWKIRSWRFVLFQKQRMRFE